VLIQTPRLYDRESFGGTERLGETVTEQDTDRKSDGASTEIVLVIGAGTMGRGIAQAVAEAGHATLLFDADQRNLERGLAALETAWERAVQKGKLASSDARAARTRLQPAQGLDEAAAAAIVIEAIFEDPEIKVTLFRELDAIVPESALLASNTSSISITRLAAAVKAPGRFLGLHFFNPVPVLPLVEVVRGLRTDEATVNRALGFVRGLGKTPVVVNDSPGFVVNRVLLPMINEAVLCLAEGVAGKEAIDEVMKLGASHPLGPLALADLIGLDVCLDIMRTLHRDLGDDKYRPAPLLARMVDAGKLGRKGGEGFYRYDR
jgi:3-hydroxybutyryl-CoA dehydrogenase